MSGLIVNFTTDYALLTKIEKVYQTPWVLLASCKTPIYRKKQRLARWYDERIRYLFEHGREFDFHLDKTLTDIEYAIKLIRSLEDAIDKNTVSRLKARAIKVLA